METQTAIKSFDEAFDRTITLLWPPRPGVWMRIALIALFLGGGMTNPIQTEDIELSDSGMTGFLNSSTGSENIGFYLTIGIGLLIAGFIYVIISAIFQFVFVDCLSSGNITLLRPFSLRWRKGIHLMGFYLVLLAIILICACLVTSLIIIPKLLYGMPDTVTLLISIIETLIILLLILIPIWVIAILTADFVVPVMIVDDCGLIVAARRFFLIFAGRWIEAGIYTGLKILLIFIVGIILGIIIFIVSIPLGLLRSFYTIGIGPAPVMNLTNMISIGFGTVAMVLISLLFLVPLITFFRYYSLAVLRDLCPRYNLLPIYTGS